ncbi:hypothetical protein PUN28_001052 [Cardiocondyla obscurior]|uniref:Ribosomal protein S14 n=1 Tax=Cardiocondyla obscurior TaxID=286306 RepID=A0AAW2H2S1_9HYME
MICANARCRTAVREKRARENAQKREREREKSPPLITDHAVVLKSNHFYRVSRTRRRLLIIFLCRKITWHDRCEFPDRACTGPLRVPV